MKKKSLVWCDRKVTFGAELQAPYLVKTGCWLLPCLWWTIVVAASCYGRGMGRLVRIEEFMNALKFWETFEENLLQSPHNLITGAMFYFSVWQQTEAYNQDVAGVALGQVSECSWQAQPKPWLEHHRTSVAPEDGSSQMLLWLSLRGSARQNGRNCPSPGVRRLTQDIQ